MVSCSLPNFCLLSYSCHYMKRIIVQVMGEGGRSTRPSLCASPSFNKSPQDPFLRHHRLPPSLSSGPPSFLITPQIPFLHPSHSFPPSQFDNSPRMSPLGASTGSLHLEALNWCKHHSNPERGSFPRASGHQSEGEAQQSRH